MSGVDLSAECMTFFVLLHFLGILQVLHRTKERQKKKVKKGIPLHRKSDLRQRLDKTSSNYSRSSR